MTCIMSKLNEMLTDIVRINTWYTNPGSDMLPQRTENIAMNKQVGCRLISVAPRHTGSPAIEG